MGEIARPNDIVRQYECGPIQFSGTAESYYERRLLFDNVVDPAAATPRQRFEAVALALRDLLTQRWLKTTRTHDQANPKRVYYLSMEFLVGRSLTNNVTNLRVDKLVRDALAAEGLDLMQLADAEPDAGLGNGGLGRLAACFVESMATLQLPAMGYGLRYEYGIFNQKIEDGYQREQPDRWLRDPDPWEVARPAETVEVPLASSVDLRNNRLVAPPGQSSILGVPCDRPVVGYGGKCINTLRLWRTASTGAFDFQKFSSGDLVGAAMQELMAESVSRVLYPDDSTITGQALRFVQEYVLVACSLADIVARFRRAGNDWFTLADKVAIQLNDTHPALAVAELMRILVDQACLGWDDAWRLTVAALAYTNHTLLPEALEKWPVDLFRRVCPRLLEIIEEVNGRFLRQVRERFPGDEARVRRMSVFEEATPKQVRMAHLAVIGTHSTNGVAEIHSELLTTHVLRDFAGMYPERFGNKTNGVTPRRWLLLANPALSALVTEAVRPGWETDLYRLRQLEPLADDANFREKFAAARRVAKVRFADWLRATAGVQVDPDSVWDSQIKRFHEYKRQLLNVLHIISLYHRLRDNPSQEAPPRTFFFAGKAAPAYQLAKRIIKLINNLAAVIDRDPVAAGRLKVVFLPDYSVTLAERLIPASDVSEQISTAGFEASGTGNMKFMMNGALTVGTRDGATIEMAREAGEDNFFLFGLSAEQVAASRSWYNPWWHYQHERETRAALDALFGDHFSRSEPGIFAPIKDALFVRGDYYMHLADLGSYADAQAKVAALYRDPGAWWKKAILNVAASGRFSSDRTIAEYARDIWKATPCPVE